MRLGTVGRLLDGICCGYGGDGVRKLRDRIGVGVPSGRARAAGIRARARQQHPDPGRAADDGRAHARRRHGRRASGPPRPRPRWTATPADGQVWIMHDDTDVYLAFTRTETTPGLAYFQIYFDNAHDGVVTTGDDSWAIGIDTATGVPSARRQLLQRLGREPPGHGRRWDDRDGRERDLHVRHRRARLRAQAPALHVRRGPRRLPHCGGRAGRRHLLLLRRRDRR